jgi:hypothetical protein
MLGNEGGAAGVSAGPLLPRALCFAAAAVLAVVNARAPVILGDVAASGLVNSLMRLFGVSAVVWFACYAMAALALRDRRPSRLSAGDGAVLAMLILACLAPVVLAATAMLLGAGLWLWRTSAAGTADRAVALILLGLAAHFVAAPLILSLFGPIILAIDSFFAALFTGTAVDGNLINYRGVDGGYVVFGGCSSVGNMSLGLLMWITLAQLFALRPDRRLAIYFLASMGALFAINTVRLVSFAWFPAAMDDLHHGVGAALFAWASLIAMAAIAGAGIVDAARRAGPRVPAHG